MDKTKEVKELLLEYYQVAYYPNIRDDYARQICQLFEPHDEAMETELAWRKRKVIGEEPSGNSLFEIKPISNAQTGEGIMSNAPNPDERLLESLEHKTYEEGASYDTGYRVITKCEPDCPLCKEAIMIEKVKKIFEPKPDDRLLTNAEMQTIRNEIIGYVALDSNIGMQAVSSETAQAQDAKTASICKAQEQQRVERIKREIERKGLGSYMGTISLTAGEWQALWKE